MKTLATAAPPKPLAFQWHHKPEDRFARWLEIQAVEHFDFDKSSGIWQPVWIFSRGAKLALASDFDESNAAASRNRDELRDSIQDSVQQVLTQQMSTYLGAHYEGSKRVQVPTTLVAMITWFDHQAKASPIARDDYRRALSALAFGALHPRAVALALLEDANNGYPLQNQFPIVAELIDLLAAPYIADDPYYGVELQVRLHPQGGCNLKIVAGERHGHKDRFVVFI